MGKELRLTTLATHYEAAEFELVDAKVLSEAVAYV